MRLIDADALIEDIKTKLWDWDTIDGITSSTVLRQTITDIGNAPTIDAVPVVRCKDCVHGTDRAEEFGEGCVNPIACMMYSSDGEPDFFPKDNYCGFGERKDDE